MASSRWTWTWFLAAFIFFSLGFAYQVDVLGAGMTIGDAMATPPAQTPQGQKWIRELKHEGNVATAKVVVGLVIASLFLGTGIRMRFQWPIVRAYFVAFLICPAVLITADFGVLLFLKFFPS